MWFGVFPSSAVLELHHLATDPDTTYVNRIMQCGGMLAKGLTQIYMTIPVSDFQIACL